MKQKKRIPIIHLILQERIEEKIFLIRGHKIMLDRDLAKLYGVETKYLNRQVKRNIQRFPQEFMFHLSVEEKNELVTNWHRFKTMKHSSTLPYAFTEYGALMLANVLKSSRAIKMSIAIIRTFIKLREIAVTHKDLQQKIEAMERKYDKQFKVVFEAIGKLLTPPEKSKRRIGF
ncbi:MAG: ORF6N domain-containing protein [Omnitrophica bacterium]|nr:ORF6N domain-containing protein [Candidatus Omnitrophota bacterium]